jgi:pyruvyltransferase
MNILKILLKNLIFNFYYLIFRDRVIYVDYRVWKNNFGDLVNKYLIEKLSGKKVIRIESQYFKHNHLLAIGSILGNANDKSIVWGSGFISDDSFSQIIPKKVLAVRGKLSREKLLINGVDCPEIYGDPALLLPLIYNPKRKTKYKIGIIPHYIDKNHPWIKLIETKCEGIKIIDIQQKKPLSFIDDILCCEIIFSSSLHGIIVADAYKIPNSWIKLSNKLIGDEFKFHDYFSSVNKNQEAFKVKSETEIEEILKTIYTRPIEFSGEALINSAPFKILGNFKK